MPLYDFRCPTCGKAYEVTRPATRADDPLLCPTDETPCERVVAAPSEPAPMPSMNLATWRRTVLANEEWMGGHPHPEGIAPWSEVLAELRGQVGPWMEQLRATGIRGGDVFSACIGPAIQIWGGYSRVQDIVGRPIPLGGDPEATEPHLRGYLAYVWEVLGRAALDSAFGAVGAEVGGGASDSIESDARLTVLFLLWTEPPADQPEAPPSGRGLVPEVVRSFTKPLGIHLEDWEGRIIGTEAGEVRLLPLSARAPQLLGADGEPRLSPGATALDRLHTAMLLQANGRTEALQALLRAEEDRGPQFLRIADALSRLYPAGSDEQRLLDAVLAAAPANRQ
ncbi:MAG: zinc ribbon domain-containing protein [Dehalococcoidia bacterium]